MSQLWKYEQWRQAFESYTKEPVNLLSALRLTAVVLYSESQGKHSSPVWQVRWVDRDQGAGEERDEILISISADGRVTKWSIRKGFESAGENPVGDLCIFLGWSGKSVALRRESSLGSLSKQDVDYSEDITWKCNFAFLQLFLNYSVITLAKCVLTILELNWNQRFRGKKTKLNICRHMLTLSTQLLKRSFRVEERTRTSAKCQKMKYARAKRAKLLFFIVKYANLWRSCCLRRRGCLSSLL